MALQKNIIVMTDGQELEVTPIYADALAFEAYLRAHRHLGNASENGILATGFRAWAAARREHKTDESWETFSPRIGDIQIPTGAALEEHEVDLGGGATGESMPTAP